MAVVSELIIDGENVLEHDNSIISSIVDENGVNYHFAKNTESSGVCEKAVNEPIINMELQGNSIQSLLPIEYQEVEFLENSGTQRIDLGLIPTNSTSIDVTYQALAIQGYSQYIAGARESASAAVRYAINGSSSNRYWDVRFNGVTNTITEIERTTNKYRSNIQINNGNGTWTLTDLTTNTDYTLSISGAKVPAVSNLFLFAYLNLDANTHANLRIFACKIYEAGVLVRNLKPCYRTLDNKAGMYDLVTNEFYTNAGTGEFVVGADIESVPSPEQPIEIKSVGDKTINLWEFDLKEFNVDTKGETYTFKNPITKDCTFFYRNNNYNSDGNIWLIGFLYKNGNYQYLYPNHIKQNTIRNFTATEDNPIVQLLVRNGGSGYISAGSIDNLMLVEGTYTVDTMPSFEPYGYKIPINICGENLANENTIQENKLIGNSANGIINDSTSYNTLYMEVEQGSTYIMQNFVRVDGTTLKGCFYDSNGTWVSAFEETKVTIPSGVKYIGRSFSKEAKDVAVYKIYSIANIYLNEPLRKLGEYADILDYKNNKVIRKIWAEKPTFYDQTYFGKSFAVVTTYQVFNRDTTKRYVMCNYMQGTNAQPSASERAGKVFIGSASNYIGFGSTPTFPIAGDNATASERQVFETWLNNNDVFVYYVLATPTEETIEVPEISTPDGTTTFEIVTQLEPSGLLVKYWKQI